MVCAEYEITMKVKKYCDRYNKRMAVASPCLRTSFGKRSIKAWQIPGHDITMYNTEIFLQLKTKYYFGKFDNGSAILITTDFRSKI